MCHTTARARRPPLRVAIREALSASAGTQPLLGSDGFVAAPHRPVAIRMAAAACARTSRSAHGCRANDNRLPRIRRAGWEEGPCTPLPSSLLSHGGASASGPFRAWARPRNPPIGGQNHDPGHLPPAARRPNLSPETRSLLRRDLELAPALRTPATLYGICVLEFASALLDARSYRTCGNERCGRLFTLQEGRSRTGRHRPDVARYCSKRCADQQAMRGHRRKAAGARRAGG